MDDQSDRSCSSEASHTGDSKACSEEVFVDHHRNQFGDTFTLTAYRKAKTGVLTGSDIDEYRIARNCVIGDVILGEEEFAWLSNAWRRATGGSLNPMCCPAALFKGMPEQAGGSKP